MGYKTSPLDTTLYYLKTYLPDLHAVYTHLRSTISRLTPPPPQPAPSAEVKEQKVPPLGASDNKKIQIEESFLSAWKEDRLFVIQYLVARLHDIHTKKIKEKDVLYIVPLTRMIHKFVTNELAKDVEGKDCFHNELLTAWAAYAPKPEGLFSTLAERNAFLEEMGGDELLGKQFVLQDKQLAEQKRQSDFQSAIAAVKSPTKPSNYFEKYHLCSKEKQCKLINDFRLETKGEGFTSHDIVLSVAKMASDFGLDNFTFAICGSGNGKDEYDLASQLTMALHAEVRFILTIFQSMGSTHAVAGFIDKITGVSEIVDPSGGGGQQEFLQRMEMTLPILKEFSPKATLVAPPDKITIFPQQPNDNDCGIYTAISLFALLLYKMGRVKAKSDIPEVATVLQSLELDVAKGKLPEARFLKNYLGPLLLARTDALQDEKLQKQWQKIFADAGAVSEVVPASALRRRA